MCDSNSLQHHIRRLTNNGEVVARFLVDTVEGKHADAKYHHKLQAAKLLERYGLTGDEQPSQFWGLIPTPEELALKKNTPSPLTGEGRDGGENPPDPVTYLDILNYELAQLVRKETGEGHTIAQFYYHVMTGRDEPFTPKRLRIKPADRMTAAMEVLRRGHGHFGRRRRLIDDAEEGNDYDRLHSDLAKRLRQYGERGSDAILFLHNVMQNAYPEEEYTMRHRVSAAQELSRRGWDTNYDRIKMEHLMDYWRDQEDAVLSVGQKKHLAGLHTYADEYDLYDDKGIKYYESTAKDLHEQQDRESEEYERQRNASTDTPSPLTGEGRDGGEKDNNPASPTENSELTDDDLPDCYYEPLSPEDQAIFDYQTRLESGDFEEGEIEIQPVTETMRKEYAATLNWMRKVAAEEGVPLLPNPLSGTLQHPNARSP